MKASQSVYLTEDRQRAVAEGDTAARTLLVRAGSEISDEKLDSIEGARDLAEGSVPAVKAEAAPAPQATTKPAKPSKAAKKK